jgi:hypothetical protein
VTDFDMCYQVVAQSRKPIRVRANNIPQVERWLADKWYPLGYTIEVAAYRGPAHYDLRGQGASK